MNTISDNRPISDAPYDTVANEMPTIGRFIHETLDMQTETFATISIIAEMMWGDKITEPAFTPKENIMAGLAAIQENQRAILTAIKAIAGKL